MAKVIAMQKHINQLKNILHKHLANGDKAVKSDHKKKKKEAHKHTKTSVSFCSMSAAFVPQTWHHSVSYIAW